MFSGAFGWRVDGSKPGGLEPDQPPRNGKSGLRNKGKPGDKNSATVGVIKVPRLMPLPRERFIATKGSVEDLYYFSLALAPAFQ